MQRQLRAHFILTAEGLWPLRPFYIEHQNEGRSSHILLGFSARSFCFQGLVLFSTVLGLPVIQADLSNLGILLEVVSRGVLRALKPRGIEAFWPCFFQEDESVTT